MFPNGHQEITSCGSLTRFCASGLHLLDCLEHISSDSKGSARCLCYRLLSQLWATVHGASFSANPLSAPGSVRLLAPATAESSIPAGLDSENIKPCWSIVPFLRVSGPCCRTSGAIVFV